MPDPGLKVTIIGSSSARPCGGKCGMDWSTPEALARAREMIATRFGEDVRLEYADLAESDAAGMLSKLKRRGGDMTLPLLLANGYPRIAGEFDIRQLMDVIEADLEKAEGHGGGRSGAA